jgi:hypothetical protein
MSIGRAIAGSIRGLLIAPATGTAFRIVAWLLLAGLIVVTIGPIGWRPVSPLPTQLERAAALAIIGFIFALAYPRHLMLVAALLLGATALLEALQLLEPGRHGRILDLVVKLAGGGCGFALGWLLIRLQPRADS